VRLAESSRVMGVQIITTLGSPAEARCSRSSVGPLLSFPCSSGQQQWSVAVVGCAALVRCCRSGARLDGSTGAVAVVPAGDQARR
jgi:hypothetical protein